MSDEMPDFAGFFCHRRSQPGRTGMIFRTSYQTPKGTRCATGRLRMENSKQKWGVDSSDNTLEERRERRTCDRIEESYITSGSVKLDRQRMF